MRLKRILSKKLRVFCEHSTLHGACYLARGQAARITWGLIMAAGVALWCLLSHMIWQKYNIDPTVTVVESTYYRSEQIPFPSVLICDPLPVYGPNAKNISDILSSRGYEGSEIDEFYDSFTAIHDTNYVPPSHVRKMHSLLQDLGLTIDVLFNMFKKPCNVTLKKCRWRSKKYDCSSMFREAVTIVGHCCLFDMDYFKKNVPSNTTFVSGPRPQQALEVTVDGVKAYPNGIVTDGSVLFYQLDAGQEVTEMDGSLALASSSYFDIELEIFAIDSSPEVKALSLATRKCVLPTPVMPDLVECFRHVEKDCTGPEALESRETVQHVLRDAVHLLDERVRGSKAELLVDDDVILSRKSENPSITTTIGIYNNGFLAELLGVKEYPNCTWERYTCVHSQTETNFADIQSLIRMNDCYQFCDYVEYDPRIDFIRKRDSSSKNDTYTKVAVHFASTTCIKYRREVIYTWDQMLANLGGIFGLCLGGSVISIIEIVWLIIDLFVAYVKNFTQAKPKGKKVSFVIEKENMKQDKKDTCYKFVN